MMNPEPLPDIPWAKLISQDPDEDDILLCTKSNEPKSFEIKNKWRIYQDSCSLLPVILNLSASRIKVNDTLLEKNQEQFLSGGEMITFRDQKKKTCKFDYVFVLMKEPKNSKRTRPDHNKSSKISPTIEHKKSPKIQEEEDDLREQLACCICMETFYNPVIVNPCGHHFCSACLSENFKFTTQCPTCREEILSFRKDDLLKTLISQATKIFNSLQISNPSLQQEEDLISQGYKIIRSEGGVYFGQCENGEKNGKGKMTYSDGNVFQGVYKNAKREGKGKLTLSNGNIYEAKWIDDKIITYPVTITFSNGDVYVGEIQDFFMHNGGILTFQNGDKYTGSFVRGKIEGYGVYNYSNGDIYKGAFINQMKHGYGEMKYANGEVYKGDWKNDKKDEKRISKNVFGLEFHKGMYKNDRYFGKGE